MATTTVSLDGLRELAGFRAQNGCAVTLYVDLDPSVSPTPREVAVRVHALLDKASRSHGATRGDLSHEARAGVKADLERIEQYVDGELDRDGAHGLAVYAAGLDNVWSVLGLPWKVEDVARVADDFLLSPLVPLIGRGNGALVSVVGREQGRVLALRGGRLVQVADLTEETPGQHDQGGWSQARFRRHIDNLDQEHFRAVADELEQQYRRLGRPRIVFVTNEEHRGGLGDALSAELEDAVIGWTSAEAHASDSDLAGAVAPFIDEWRASCEREVVERWRQEVGKHALGAAGWEATLEAASDGRVETLLYRPGAQHAAKRCPKCGRAAVDTMTCPLDGTSMEHRDDALDLAVRLTLSFGGDLLAVERDQTLDPAGGIGAILRF